MRKTLSGWAVLCAGVAVAIAAAEPVRAAQDVRPAIQAANKQFGSHFGRGDGGALAGLYTADAQLFPPNGDAIGGREAIQTFWQGVIGSGVKGAKLTTTEATASGDTAYEVGQYELSGADGKVLDRGKYIVIWKRDGGQWRLHRDIWNTSMPAAR